MRAMIEYDLSKPEEVYAHKCAQRALEACQLLESLKGLTQGYTAYKGLSESVLADIIADLSKWDNVRI